MDIYGANIVCIDNNGRDDLLTVGQTYNVDSDGDIVTNEGNYMGVGVFNGGVRAGLHGNITFELEGDTLAGTQTVLATNRHFIGRKINRIKRIRQATGLGLKEAKKITDKFGFYGEGTVEAGLVIVNAFGYGEGPDGKHHEDLTRALIKGGYLHGKY